jgi:serralysin
VTNVTTNDAFVLDTDAFAIGSALGKGAINRSSTGFDVNLGDGETFHYTGTNFTYDASNNLTGGTITGLSDISFNTPIYDLSGFSVAATTWVQWVHDNNNDAAKAMLFGGDDSILGGNLDDNLDAFGGNDIVWGRDGADTIIGGDGNDHLYGQSPSGGTDGADTISGGNGSDYIQGNAGNDTLDGGLGSDRINGGKDNDLISGGAGADRVNGNAGNDTIDGGTGNDWLRGGKDDDLIHGGNDNDSIQGDLGNDTLAGDSGVDTLTGGDGADQFKFASGDATIISGSSATDVITDFVHGTDHIALGFSVSAVLTATSDPTSFSAAVTTAQQLFDGHSGNGEVAALHVGSDTYLFFSSSGGATVDSAINLQAVAAGTLATSDFV